MALIYPIYAGESLRRIEVSDILPPMTNASNLYNYYGITNYPTTKIQDATFYSLLSFNWLEEIKFNEVVLYDETTSKWFIKYVGTSGAPSTFWLTLYDMQSTLYNPYLWDEFHNDVISYDPMSPTNKLTDMPVFNLSNMEQVETLQYEYDGKILYFIKPNKLNGIQPIWRTEEELNSIGYSFIFDVD